MAMSSQPGTWQPDRAEIVAMSDEVVQMMRFVKDAFAKLDAQPVDRVNRLAELVHRQEHGLIARLLKGAGTDARAADEGVAFVPMHLEQLAEHIETLSAAIAKMVHEGTLFTNRATREVSGLFDTVVELLEGLRDALKTGNATLIRYVLDAGRSCELRANEYALVHEQRLIEGVSQPRASSAYLAILDSVKGIEWHARQVAEELQRAPWSVHPDRGEPIDRLGHVRA